MRDELPQEIQSLIAQCEANVSGFDNNQMSIALHYLEMLYSFTGTAIRGSYDLGYRNGLEAYAHWKDGRQYVGTCGVTLDEAVKNRRSTFNYLSPQPGMTLAQDRDAKEQSCMEALR